MKKKSILVTILIIIEVISIFLMYKSSNKAFDTLNDVKAEVNKKMLAMYIEDTYNSKNYIEYNENKFPEGYTLNTTKSICEDINREVVPNALSQAEDGNIKVTSNKTVYCYVYFDRKPAPEKACSSGKSSLSEGTEYVNGPYTYQYKKSYIGSGWSSLKVDGWGVKLTDLNSTTPVTEAPCTTIDNKPVVSTSFMFYQSKAESIDLRNFNTNNITDMRDMFAYTEAAVLDVSSFNTSNVTSLHQMFLGSSAKLKGYENFDTSNVTTMQELFLGTKDTASIDISKWNTSKVTRMWQMFASSQASSINLGNINTSQVTTMGGMFTSTKATTISGYENLDTSNVNDMYHLFAYTNLSTINVENFNTLNVTDMHYMFEGAKATTITGLKKINTSKVTDMSGMFSKSNVQNLDLSNFDTSQVINMSQMFLGAQTTTITGLNNLNTSRVTDMSYMFKNTVISTLDLSGWNTSKVTNMTDMFDGAQATVGYARTSADANRFNASSNKPEGLTFTTK